MFSVATQRNVEKEDKWRDFHRKVHKNTLNNTQGLWRTSLSFRETSRQNPQLGPIVTKLCEFKLLED